MSTLKFVHRGLSVGDVKVLAEKVLFFFVLISLTAQPGSLAAQSPSFAGRASLGSTVDFPGSTFDARLAACIESLPSAGGICDSRGDSGSRTIAATVTVPVNVTVLLGAGTYKSKVLPAFILAGSGASLLGLSKSATHLVANLRYGAIVEGPFPGQSNQRLENLSIDDTSPGNAGSIGIEWRNEANSVIRNVHIRKVETGLVVEGVPRRSGAYYNEIENVSAYDFYTGVRLGAHAISNTFINLFLDMGRRAGIQVDPSAGGNIFVKPDVEVQAKGTLETGYVINSNANTLLQPYVEAVSTGFEIGSSASQNIILGGMQSSLNRGIINHAGRWANTIISPNLGYVNGLSVYSLNVANSTVRDGVKITGAGGHLKVLNPRETDFGSIEAEFWVPGTNKGGAVGKIQYGGATATFKIPASGVAANSTHSFVIDDVAQTLRNKTLAQPKLASSAFFAFPKEVNGMMIYCSDCAKTTPCRGGGHGAIAKGISGKWDCN